MEEKKTYTIIGKVEIGTDEYRDLIESLAYATHRANENDDERRKEYWAHDKTKKELTSALVKLANLNDFVNSSEEMKTKYKLFLAEQQLKEQGDDE